MQVITVVDLSVSRAAMASERCKRSVVMQGRRHAAAGTIEKRTAGSVSVRARCLSGDPRKVAYFRWTAIKALGPSPLS
jgi:hypothetical protein